MPRKKGKINKHLASKAATPVLSSSSHRIPESFSEGQTVFMKAEVLMNQRCYNALQVLINAHINELPAEEAIYVHLTRHMFFDARFECQARMESEDFLAKHFKKIQKHSNEIADFAFHYTDILIREKNRPDEAFKKLMALTKEDKEARMLWLQLRGLPLYLETTAARGQTQAERYKVLFDKVEPLYHQLIEKRYLFAHLGFFEMYLIFQKGGVPFERKYYDPCVAQAMELGHYSYILASLQIALQIDHKSKPINSAKRMYNVMLKLHNENRLSWGGVFCLACIANLLLEAAREGALVVDFFKNISEVAVLFEKALELSKGNAALYSQTLLYYFEFSLSEPVDSPQFSETIWKAINDLQGYRRYLPYHFSQNTQKGNAVQRYTAILLSFYQKEISLAKKDKIRSFLQEVYTSFDESNLNRSTKKQLRQVLSNPISHCEINPDRYQNFLIGDSLKNDAFISKEEWNFLKTGKVNDSLFETTADYYVEAIFLYSQKEKDIFTIWESAFIAFAQKSQHAACLIGCLLIEMIKLSYSGETIKPYLQKLRCLFVEQGVLVFSFSKETHPVFLELYTSLLIFLVMNEELTANIESVPEEMDKTLIPHMLVGFGDFNENVEAQVGFLLKNKLLSKDIFDKFVDITKSFVENVIKGGHKENDIAILTYRDLQACIVSYFLKKLEEFSFDEKYYPITASYHSRCLAFLQSIENPLTQTVLQPVYQAATLGLVEAKNWLIENTPLKEGELILQGKACRMLQLTYITNVFGFGIEEAALRVQKSKIIEKYSPPTFCELMMIAYAISLCATKGIEFSVLRCRVDGLQGTLEITSKINPSLTCWDMIKQYQDKISEKREFIKNITKNISYFVGKITVAMGLPLQEADFTFSDTHIAFISKCSESLPDFIYNNYDSCIKKAGSLFYAKLSIQRFLMDPEILEISSHQAAAHLSSAKKETQREFSREELSALQGLSLLAEQKKLPEKPVIENIATSEPIDAQGLTI